MFHANTIGRLFVAFRVGLNNAIGGSFMFHGELD